jgi:hypothetical protein
MYTLDNTGNRVPFNVTGGKNNNIIQKFDNELQGKSSLNKVLLVGAFIMSLLAVLGGSYAIYRYMKSFKRKETFGYRL